MAQRSWAGFSKQSIQRVTVSIQVSWTLVFHRVFFGLFTKHTGTAHVSVFSGLWLDSAALPPLIYSMYWAWLFCGLTPFWHCNLSADALGWFATMCSFMQKRKEKNNVMSMLSFLNWSYSIWHDWESTALTACLEPVVLAKDWKQNKTLM